MRANEKQKTKIYQAIATAIAMSSKMCFFFLFFPGIHYTSAQPQA